MGGGQADSSGASEGWSDQLAWSVDGEGHATGALHASWGQGRALFGGLVAAGLLRQLEGLVGPERRLRSLLVSFVGPVAPGQIEADSELLRAGRAMSQAQARLRQGGQVCCVVQGAFGADRPTAFQVEAPRMPSVPAPESLPALPFIDGVTPSFTRHFDYRWTHQGFPFTGAAEAWVQGWVRFAEPVQPDAASLLGLLDAWPAPFLSITDRPLPASSVTWQVQLLADPAAMAAPGDWFLYDARTSASGAGYSDFTASLWHRGGTLVAQSRQLVAEFSAR